MIIGIDVGNYGTKTSQMIHFQSKVSKTPNLLKETSIKYNGEKLHIGEGTWDTEYRKINKQYLKPLMLYSIALSTQDTCNKTVLGLPVSQYKQDKDALKQIITSQKTYDIEINNISRRIIIEDCEVYPEGVAAVVGTDYQGVVIDPGGRTTDCFYIEDNHGTKKVKNPISYPVGTLNLYSDFVKVLNAKYILELKTEDAHRIILNGLKIDGITVDISEGVQILKEFVERLIRDIRLEYGVRTNDVLITGGGCELLGRAIIKRLPQAKEMDNYYFANALGFKRIGDQIWR